MSKGGGLDGCTDDDDCNARQTEKDDDFIVPDPYGGARAKEISGVKGVRSSVTPSPHSKPQYGGLFDSIKRKKEELQREQADPLDLGRFKMAQRAAAAAATGQGSDDDDDDQDNRDYGVSPSEMELRLKYMTNLSELQHKEQEIFQLKQQLATAKSRVVKTADIKPTKYSGAADLNDYLTQFNSIAKFNGWSTSQKAVVLLSKLEGEALTAAAVLDDPTWDELVEHLRENFSNDRQELAALRLQNRLQQPEESLESLSLDIQKLVKKAYPLADEGTRSRLARDAFINAVSDHTTRDRLRDKNLAHLRDCLQEAKRIHANLEVEQNRSKTFPSSGQKVRQVESEADYVLKTEFENFKLQSTQSAQGPPKSKPTSANKFRQRSGTGLQEASSACVL